VHNALRSSAGHLNDRRASVYSTPPLDDDDEIATTEEPLHATGKVIDASGGWWDAGDYMKYVETISYTVALQQIGVRDFPDQIGARALRRPSAPHFHTRGMKPVLRLRRSWGVKRRLGCAFC